MKSSKKIPDEETGQPEDITYVPFSDVSPDPGFKPVWEDLYDGIVMARSFKNDPPLAVYCVRVDLSLSRISVIVSEGSSEKGCEYKGKRTSTFFREKKCVVAMNGTPFTPYTLKEGACLNIRGLSIAGGKMYSDVHYGYGGMSILKNKKVRMELPYGDPGVEYALEGYPHVLEYGTYRPRTKERAPRSAVGLSEDGRYLYMMVIDGRRDDYSVGVGYNEIAEWLMMHGAFTGINLDGGGSSTLVIADAEGNPVVVNKYSDPTERVVANHIGIILEKAAE